jgi:hypothetical protein
VSHSVANTVGVVSAAGSEPVVRARAHNMLYTAADGREPIQGLGDDLATPGDVYAVYRKHDRGYPAKVDSLRWLPLKSASMPKTNGDRKPRQLQPICAPPVNPADSSDE